ncbi:MAG TPA: serine hydrolase [Allosphingosinicella sp.]|nr:serine hydrolase [Allosphingosinicella sp.]
MRLRQVLHALALLCAVGFTLNAAPTKAQARRAPEAERVERFLETQMRALRIPGLQVAVVRGDRIVLLRSYGIASVELQAPVTDRTVFAINSITKAFTGVAAMRLVEEGRIDLSAPVSAYLDELPEAWRPVTIRQLLSHMSGLPDIARAPTVETDSVAAWAWVQAQPASYPPGQRYSYNQTNYTLVQMIVNRLSGRATDAPLAGWQIEAAAMERTLYGDSTEVVPGKAPSYRYTYAAPGAPGVLRPAIERFLPFRRASSGLNSTAEDMARWIIALRRGHLLGRAAIDTMWTRVPFADGRLGQWGMGWQVLSRGSGRAVGMTGGGRAAFYIYPEHDVAVVLLTNLAGSFPEDMIDAIASIYAPDLELSGVPALRIALEERGYANAAAAAAEIAPRDPALRWNEAELNDWGYRLLSSGRPREGLEILKLVVMLFPDRANAYDSVAEAYAANGDPRQAIAHYRRSLELDPGNDNAARHLRRLEARSQPR